MEQASSLQHMEDPYQAGIDARTNPEVANRVTEELFNPVPEMPVLDAPPDGSVELQAGYVHIDGSVYRDAVVRELNGADEEALSKPEVAKSQGRFMQLLLQRGVTQLGPFDNPTNNQLGSLLIGDRDILLLAIRRATYGNNFEVTVECPACGQSQLATYDLTKDIPIKPLGSERQFPVSLKKGRKVMAVLACGTDQEAILNAGNKTVPELNTLLLSRCITDEQGVPLGIEGVRALGMADRRMLLAEITDKQPGPKYQQLELECPTCGKEFPLSIYLQDLFR